MRQFASTGFQLRTAPTWLRLIYAGFLVITAIGLLTQAGFQVARIGVLPGQIATYYRGGETAETLSLPKPFGFFVELTHFHAFTMGVTFLILAHLFAASSVSGRLKGLVIAASLFGVLGDLLAPWLVRYLAAGFAGLQLASWAALWLGGGSMVCLSLWECLAGPRR